MQQRGSQRVHTKSLCWGVYASGQLGWSLIQKQALLSTTKLSVTKASLLMYRAEKKKS